MYTQGSIFTPQDIRTRVNETQVNNIRAEINEVEKKQF